MARCAISTDDAGHCPRPATTPMTATRACGHTWPLTVCTGHAESLIGTNTPVSCTHCHSDACAVTCTPRTALASTT
jgi:hypothetical protein